MILMNLSQYQTNKQKTDKQSLDPTDLHKVGCD